MNENKELLYAKLALFSMIDQFMYEITDEDGNEYFDNYCESAGESAFSVLGFTDDRISKEEFYRRYDELRDEMYKLNNLSYRSNYLDWYLEDKAKKTLKDFYQTTVKLTIDKEDLEFLGLDNYPTDTELKMAIYDAIEAYGNIEEDSTMKYPCPDCNHDAECMAVLGSDQTKSGKVERLYKCNDCLATWLITTNIDGSMEVERYFFG